MLRQLPDSSAGRTVGVRAALQSGAGDICAAAHASGAWVHVDGAFGLWAAASPKLAPLAAGAAAADSWATDAHKWLNVPYDSGYVFCAHPQAHHAAMSMTAAYLVGGDEHRSPSDFVPESSRRLAAQLPTTTAWARLPAMSWRNMRRS